VETGILNAVLATIIETVEYQLSLIFDFQCDEAPASEFIATFVDNVGYPLGHDDEDGGFGFPCWFGPDGGCGADETALFLEVCVKNGFDMFVNKGLSQV
jgi:hypothetical protein